MYQLIFDERAIKQLKKMDKGVRAVIIAWLEKNIDGINNPRTHGKGLTVDKVGLWRYRIGNYRVLVEICDDILVVEAVSVGHRKNVYKF